MSLGSLTPLEDRLQPLIREFNRCDRLSRLLVIVSPT
jgi:hypothetical protein